MITYFRPICVGFRVSMAYVCVFHDPIKAFDWGKASLLHVFIPTQTDMV